MFLKFTARDLFVLLALVLPKFAVGVITSMVIPIFPTLIMIHFNNSHVSANLNVSSTRNVTNYNYQQLSILFVAKNLCQIVTSPIIGFSIDIFGSVFLLLLGTLLQIVTLLVYGVGNFYYLLILGRIFEAVSSSSINCAAAALVAYRFKDHRQRGFIYGVNGLCLCVGCALGPAYGGVIFQYYGKTEAFLSILVLTFFEIVFVVLVIVMEKFNKEKVTLEPEKERRTDYISSMENVIPIPLIDILPARPNLEHEDECALMNAESFVVVRMRNSLVSAEEKIKLKEGHFDDAPSHNVLMFIKDPYFLISIGTFPIIFSSIFLLFSALPRYMATEFKASESQQGLIWTVNFFGYAFGFLTGNVINTRFSTYRHVILMLYTWCHALGLAIIAFVPTWWSVAIPLCVIVHVHLVSEVVMAPILATIVETRHSSKFGVMSGIIMMAIAITATIGSFSGPILLSEIGFVYMNIGVCVMNVIYAPFYLFLGRFCKSR